MMVILAVVAIAAIILTAPALTTAAPIIGMVTAGFMGVGGVASVGFAAFHDSYKIPDTQVEKVGTDKAKPIVAGIENPR